MREHTNLEKLLIGVLFRIKRDSMFMKLNEHSRDGVKICLKFARNPDNVPSEDEMMRQN